MKRRADTLLPIELSLLRTGIDLLRRGDGDFYGYAIAKELRDAEGARRLTGHGTLYRALDRLQRFGFISSRWEDPEEAAAADRPRRRLYRVTAAGQRAFEEAAANDGRFVLNPQPGAAS
jgi:DNA-binding PadR family transcriptional regulator